jgi:hypothetical protein
MDALPQVSPDKLLVLLVAGGVFSLAGLWMMFRPQKEEDLAKLKIFGLEFQSSSAGLLVFLIGAVFLIGGIMLPERASVAAGTSVPQGPAVAKGAPDKAAEGATAGQPETNTLIGKPAGGISIEGEEEEPNNTVASSNWIAPNSSISGHYGKDGDARDVFCVATEDLQGKEMIVAVSGYSFQMELQDRFGQPIAHRFAGYDGTRSIAQTIEQNAYCVAIWSYVGLSRGYVLTVGVRS